MRDLTQMALAMTRHPGMVLAGIQLVRHGFRLTPRRKSPTTGIAGSLNLAPQWGALHHELTRIIPTQTTVIPACL